MASRAAVLEESWIDAVAERLRNDRTVRRTLPHGGRLHIDRQLPFLCLYRRSAESVDRGMTRLVRAQASYLIAPREPEEQLRLGRLVARIVRSLAQPFGAFLLLELWPAAEPTKGEGPEFRIHAPQGRRLGPLLDRLRNELLEISVGAVGARVKVLHGSRLRPEGVPLLVSAKRAKPADLTVLGLEVGTVFRDPESHRLYPEVLRELTRQLEIALKRTFYEFSCGWTRSCPLNYQMLGRRAMVKAVWEVDARLSSVADRFDLLLQVTPTNAAEAWDAFRRGRYQTAPSLRYRPLPARPAMLKRRLWSAPLERVEDPTLEDLFRQKQDELDRQINLLLDIGRPNFVHGAVQVYGVVSDELQQLAERLLELCPPGQGGDDTTGGRTGAEAFAHRARVEIGAFREQWVEIDARVEVRRDIARGLMVSGGSLLIGHETRIPSHRVEALIAHEVGTHVLTYHNGRAQPFRQLYSGLPGYDALQEGLAVLSEYLVGGLTVARLRLLAARVAATRAMLDGAGFVDSFRLLTRTHGLQRRTAFTVALRIYRGGGLTKDAAYLRGLSEVLAYLGSGGELEPLLVGKVATEHLPIVRELRLRGVLRNPPLRPRLLGDPRALARARRVSRGMSVLELVKERSPRAFGTPTRAAARRGRAIG